MGESGDKMREKMNKIIFLFLQLSYSAILHVELHCITIAKFFTIAHIYKISLHLAFNRSNVKALRMTMDICPLVGVERRYCPLLFPSFNADN